MNWNKAASALVVVALGVSAGCAGCKDDNNGGTNNDTNNGTNTNNGTGTNNNGTGTNNNGTGTNNNGNAFECLETQAIDLSNITTDTVVERGDGVCYSSGSINVVSAKLTIEPGVAIAFEENAEFRVHSGGKLDAQGTAALPIVLTGLDEVRGYWKGLTFDNSESLSNILDHVVVEFAGGSTSLAALHVKGDSSSVAITNTTIRESKTLGFLLDGLGELRSFTDNTITANTTGAAAFNVASAPQIGTGNTMSGNDVEAVFLQGTSLLNAGEVVWNAVDIPYRLTETLTVRDSSDLVIEAGTELEFAEGAGLELRAEGSLAVKGAEGNPVTFTGVEKQRGAWRGVVVRDTASASNSIDWAIIEYGGGGDSEAGLTVMGNSDYPAATALTNTILRENEDFGLLLVNTRAALPAFEGNTLTANDAPVSVPAMHIGQLAASDFSGNDTDIAFVTGQTVESPQTVANIGIPYRFDATVLLREGGGFTIEPGTILEFASDAELKAMGTGYLEAVGEAGNPIIFRGETPNAGFWKGVVISQTSSANNKLQHVEIAHGGSSSSPANLSLNTCCGFALRAEVSDVKLADGSKAGLDVSTTANTPADFFGCSNITFENVASEIVGTYATLADFQAVCQ